MNVEPINPSGTPSRHGAVPLSTLPVGAKAGNGGSSNSKPDESWSEDENSETTDAAQQQTQKLVQILLNEFQAELPTPSSRVRSVISRIAAEVERICQKSDRIQGSGQVQTWKLTLARHRMQKCLNYYKLGSRRGRVELHSHLSAMVYRQIAPARSNLGFQGRYGLIEDFLQSFYIEVMKAFRRENGLPDDYSPRTQLELAEYMSFADQYAKRRISLPGRRNQQLIVLRAQGFANRLPQETSMDIELAMESSKGEDSDIQSRSPLMQQVRDQMVSEATDPSEAVLRDRVIKELVEYLESQGQTDCVDYLTLKLQDLSVPEIDEILGLTARQRDYLQQRFKYHVEKFARSHRWQLVHQWLGADVDQNLGMTKLQWDEFYQELSPEQQQLLQLKGVQSGDRSGNHYTDQDIAKILKCTPKQVHKRWVKLLEMAWQFRNQS